MGGPQRGSGPEAVTELTAKAPGAEGVPLWEEGPSLGHDASGGGPAAARERDWRLLASGVLVVAAAGAVGLALLPDSRGDLEHFRYWTRLVTLEGIESAYSGEYPHTYAIYPPVILYFFKVAGHIYQWLVDPSFGMSAAMASRELAILIKLVAIGFHVATGAALFRLVGRVAGGRLGFLACATYVLNPTALYDVAVWGQPDSVHGFFLVLTFGLLGSENVVGAWVAYTLAALSKPQAWPLGPLVAWATLVRYGVTRTVLAGVAALGTASLVLVPFLLSGRVKQFLRLPLVMNDIMGVISAYAHNFWWLATRGHQPLIWDHEMLWGPVTYRVAAIALLVLVGLYSLWLLGPDRRPEELHVAGAFLAMGWFVVTSRAHENHLFLALPLLALVWHRHRVLLWVYGAASLTMAVNMAVHDPLFAPRPESIFPGDPLWWVQMANSAANVAVLTAWAVFLARWRLARAAGRPWGDPGPGRQTRSQV